MLLSDRMRAVVGLVEPCNCMADIGCDHGYVSMELIKNNICKRMIAMDINHGPLELAKSNIRTYEMQNYIDTRISDGTEALKPDEADGIICAGMGGRLIIHILTSGMDLVKGMKELILQPQSELDEVRKFLRLNGFCIEKEDMVYEDGKYYPMMRVVPQHVDKKELEMAGQLSLKHFLDSEKENFEEAPLISELSKEEAQKMTRVKDLYGPYLLEKKHPVLKNYLLWQKENLENILGNLKSQKKPSARQQYRMTELEQELGDIVFCLYKYFS